jgi:hypothetical protein
MIQTIQGIYRNGKIELLEPPQGITESQVYVTFVPQMPSTTTQHLMTFGMFSGVQQSTEADFQEAEFHGDAEDALDWA